MALQTVTRTTLTCDGCKRIGPSVEGGAIEASTHYNVLGWQTGANGDRCPRCIPFTGEVVACSEFMCENRRRKEEPRPMDWLLVKVGEQEREREYCSWRCLSNVIECITDPDACK